MRLIAGSGAAVAALCTESVHRHPAAGQVADRGHYVDPAAAERGRVALTLKGFLKPEWSEAAYRNASPGSGTSRLPIRTRTRPAMPPHSATATACTRPPIPTTACRWACAAGSAQMATKTGHADRLHGLPRRLDRRQELRRAGQYPARSEGRALRADDRRRQAPAVLHVRAQLLARDQQRRPDRRGALEPAQSRPLGPLVPAAPGCQPPRDGHARRGGT